MPEKIKVVLVDDNEDERTFMKEGFTSSGLYEVVAEASNGDELLQLMHQLVGMQPQVVVSDLNMPGMNGYEVLLEARTDPIFEKINIAILSNAPYFPFTEKCKKLGACAYFTKPDTFLEYERFAREIYEELKACIHN